MKKESFFPILETDNLILRKLELNDASVILRLRNDQVMLKYIEMYKIYSLDEAREVIKTNNKKFTKGKSLIWGIQLKDDKQLIGYLGYHTIIPEHFRAEVCYLLLPEFWGRGITTEAMNCIMSYAFYEMKLHRIESVIMKGNIGSVRIALKTGFKKEAHFRQNICYKGKFYDYLVYAMIRPDYEK